MAAFVPTPEQTSVLGHGVDRHARVLAGPGTGKSATLVALVDQLLSGDPAPRLKLLTFTRAATGELAKKVSEHPAAAAERPSTIHSFAISVLLRNPGTGDFPQPLRIGELNIPFSDPDIVERMLAEPNNRRMLEVLRLLVNRSDSLGWASLLQVTAGIGDAFFDYVYERACAQRIQFGRALLDAYAEAFPGGPAGLSVRARRLIESLLRWLDAHEVPDATPEEGWGDWIIATAGDDTLPEPSEGLPSNDRRACRVLCHRRRSRCDWCPATDKEFVGKHLQSADLLYFLPALWSIYLWYFQENWVFFSAFLTCFLDDARASRLPPMECDRAPGHSVSSGYADQSVFCRPIGLTRLVSFCDLRTFRRIGIPGQATGHSCRDRDLRRLDLQERIQTGDHVCHWRGGPSAHHVCDLDVA
jgi:hypothetical protein